MNECRFVGHIPVPDCAWYAIDRRSSGMQTVNELPGLLAYGNYGARRKQAQGRLNNPCPCRPRRADTWHHIVPCAVGNNVHECDVLYGDVRSFQRRLKDSPQIPTLDDSSKGRVDALE